MKRKGRGARGLGSVFEKKPGLWAGQIELPKDPATGARRRRWVYANTKTEATDEMKRVLVENERDGGAKPTRARLDAFLRSWLDASVKPRLRPSTVATYTTTIEKHIIPEIGALRVSRITSTQVLQFYARLRSCSVGERTVKKVHAVLHLAFASAVQGGLIRRNPVDLGRDVPRYKEPDREPLTREQAQSLLKAARGHDLEALFVLALTTGAREGELFALRWSDVDLKAGMLTIRRSLRDADGTGGLEVGTTKTGAGRRRFQLAASAVTALRRHLKRATASGSDGGRDLIFAASNGEPMRRQNFLRRDFYPLLERAELPRIHFHDLRHTAATLLAEDGVSVVAVAQLLGHKDPAVTMRTYQHAFEGAAGDASKRLGDVLRRRAGPTKKK